MELSLIITAYQNDDLTIAHIRHAMDVSRIPDEIIIINDGGKKSLKAKIKKIEKKCPIIYSRITEDILWNYNGACNLAVWLSSGKYLAFEDNDNIPSFTFYEEAIQYFKDNPQYGRIQATKRKVISLDDILNKNRKDWTITGTEGPNMGTAMIPRAVFLDMKGHDERFCGRYGYMYYDWRSRGIGKHGKDNYTYPVGEYFYTKDGQADLPRPASKQNLQLYRENAHRWNDGGTHQHPQGILNFNFETITFPRNTK